MKTVTRILSVIPDLGKGGAERLVLNIQKQFESKSDLEACLVVFRARNAYTFLSDELQLKIIPSRVVPSISGKSIIEVSDLQKFIDEFQPDVIHSHLFESEMVLAHIRLNKKVQRIVHMHDNMPQLTQKVTFSKTGITNQYERRLVLKSLKKQPTKFVCISKDTLEFAKKNTPKRFQKLLIHNAIDLSRFQFKPKSTKGLQLVMIGSLVEKKGHQLAIEIVSELKNKGIDFHLNVIGDGPLKGQIIRHIETLNVSNFVTLHGLVDHPEKLLYQSDFFLHTANYEPFGLVLIEAMATGLPVISTDGHGNRDIMNGKNGLFIDHRNPKKIALAIVELFHDEARIQSYIEAGLKTAKQHGIEEYCQKLLNWYKA